MKFDISVDVDETRNQHGLVPSDARYDPIASPLHPRMP